MKQGKVKNKKLVSLDDITTADILNPKSYKIRVTSMLDGDVVQVLKKRATTGEGRGRYQTLLNEILRNYLFGEVTENFSAAELSAIRTIAKDFIEKEKS